MKTFCKTHKKDKADMDLSSEPIDTLDRKKCVVLNVNVDDKTFARIEKGEQRVVFDYFERKRTIKRWYGKSESHDKWLVIKVWKDAVKKGNKNLLFKCDCIWDSDNWSWMGWLPEGRRYDEFDEPGEDYFILYLGDQVKFAA